MSGRNRSIIILGVVFVILAVIGVYLQSEPAVPATPTAAPSVAVWDFTNSTPQGLVVQSPTQTLSLQVVNGKWAITAPIKADESWYNAYAAKSVFNRWGRADEMVGPTLFLASDAASFVTGTLLIADGGWTAADGRFVPPGMKL